MRPALIRALDERFGDPLDAYVNGSQAWLRDDGPGGATLEWRLHPVAGYRLPAGVETHHDVFPAAALALADANAEPQPNAWTLAPDYLWDGLEAFPAYDDEFEPAQLAQAATKALGLAPDATGLVDHETVADAWERDMGGVSIVELLLEQLGGAAQA